MKKLFLRIIALYILLSCLASVVYNVSENPWTIACNRNGLLLIGFDHDNIWLLSPFCNYADVFLFGIGYDSDGIYTFSDGLRYFGHYDI